MAMRFTFSGVPRRIAATLASPDFIAGYIIVAVALLGHGLWLLNDVVPAEDWIFYDVLKHRSLYDLYAINAWFNNHGAFLPVAVLSWFANIPLAAHGFTFSLVAGSALLTYLLCSRHTRLGRQESVLVALLSLTYPADLVIHSFAMIFHPFCLFAFILAVFLAFEAETRFGKGQSALRAAAVFLFFLSFSVKSLLVFYLGFLLFHFWSAAAAERTTPGRGTVRRYVGAAWAYLCRRPEYVALPTIFWLFNAVYARFCPTDPFYNVIRLDPGQIRAQYHWFFLSVGQQLVLMTRSLPPALAVAAALAAVWVWLHRGWPNASLRPARSYLLNVAFAAFLFFCGTLPYVLVGKSPLTDTEGWLTRHSLLVAPSMALFLVAASGLAFHFVPAGARWRLLAVAALVLSCCGIRIHHCVKYQAIGVRDWSLRANLRSCPEARSTYIFGVASGSKGFGYDIKPSTCWPQFLRDIFGGELNRYALVEPWGRVSRSWYQTRVYSSAELARLVGTFGLGPDWNPILQPEDERRLRSWVGNPLCPALCPGGTSGYRPPPANAPQGTVIIEPGDIKRDSKLVAAYWYYAWFRTRELPNFLARATKVTFIRKTGPGEGQTSIVEKTEAPP